MTGEPVSFENYSSVLKRHYQITAFRPRENQFAVVFSDITERKRTEEALRESEHLLSKAQKIARLGSWSLDLAANRLTWSDENYRVFGLQPQEFGASYEAFLDIVHPEDRNAVNAAYSGSIQEGRDSYEIEHRIVHKHTGEIRYVWEKCEHIRDASGKIIRSEGMTHDITERKQAEIKLRNALAEAALSARAFLNLVNLGVKFPQDRKHVCRTFGDCTTAPRNGLVSGCYPLDECYRKMTEALKLQNIKQAMKKQN